MPKVGRVTLRVKDKTQEYDLYYSRKDGFSLKDFNKNWIETVRSIDEVDGQTGKVFAYHYETEGELVKDAENVMRRYFEITTTTKRMLLIRLGYGTSIRMKRDGIGSWGGDNPNVGRIHRDCEDLKMSWSVGFEWNVVSLVTGADKKYFSLLLNDEYEEIERSQYSDRYIESRDGFMIEWTPERHEFFKSMERGMEKMAKSMNEFFKDKDKMTALIDTKGYKLLN